jgi:hypothetical protein
LLAAPLGPLYLAAAVAAALPGCVRAPRLVGPGVVFAPAGGAAFRAVAAGTVPGSPTLIAVRWRFDDGEGPVRGRGAVRLAPPDSLRLDVAVPVLGRATLVLAGESAWAEPAAMARGLVPAREVLWAMFGVVQPPAAGTRVEAAEADGSRLFRLTSPDGVRTTLAFRDGALVGAIREARGKTIGTLMLTRSPGGTLLRSEATDREHGARFRMDVNRWEASEPFPGEIWRRP